MTRILVKAEPRRLWPCQHFLYDPAETQLRAPQPDQVTPQSVAGHVTTDASAWVAVLRIPFERLGFEPDQPQPLRVDVRVILADGQVRAWRPENPLTSRLRLGADNPADLGWLIFAEASA